MLQQFTEFFTVLCYILFLYYRVGIQHGFMILKLDFIYFHILIHCACCLHNYKLCFKLTYYTLIHSITQIICLQHFSLKKMSCGIWGNGTVIKIICCSSKGSDFNSQNLHWQFMATCNSSSMRSNILYWSSLVTALTCTDKHTYTKFI